MIFTPGLSMDKKSLFWRYGHTLVEADLRHRFHGGNHAESWREGQVFTRFYRGGSSRSRQIEGVGLGLSLSREIVHAHDGRLVLTESKEGWIAFTLTLPSLIS